jgi:hypothetical protein
MLPMTFDGKCFIAGGAEMVDDFENGIGEPLRRNLASVIEPEWKQNLVSPLLAAHRSLYL